MRSGSGPGCRATILGLQCDNAALARLDERRACVGWRWATALVVYQTSLLRSFACDGVGCQNALVSNGGEERKARAISIRTFLTRSAAHNSTSISIYVTNRTFIGCLAAFSTDIVICACVACITVICWPTPPRGASLSCLCASGCLDSAASVALRGIQSGHRLHTSEIGCTPSRYEETAEDEAL